LTPARLTYLVAGLALLLLCAAGPLYRVGLLSLTSAFTLLKWSVYVGLAAVAAALLTGGLAYRRGERWGTFFAGLACVAGLVAVGIPLQWALMGRRLPMIHDITTDLENPPAFVAVVPLRGETSNSLERPAALADQQRRGYPDVAPITLRLAVPQAFDRALAVAQEMGWQIVTADASTGRIEATATTRWFGFKDDVVVRLTAWGSGTRVDVRSVSRVGVSDTGTNARRIQQYLAALQSQP
jgi:uncharacterized protein (DUF1499 family)